MFKIGDIVRPKLGFVGHNYCFQIIEIESSPFEKDLYRIQGIKQELDPTYGPTSHQHNLIMKAEHVLWKEDELELTSDVKLCEELKKLDNKYSVTNLDDMIDANSVFLDKFAKELIRSCEIKINKMNEEENEMQILDLYENRKKEKIEEQYKEEREKIINQDTIQNIITEMQDQVNAILEEEDSYKRYRAYNGELYTEETEKELKLLDIEKYKREEELRSTLDEIRALFELTADYNERIKILKNYDILDKKGKLNV